MKKEWKEVVTALVIIQVLYFLLYFLQSFCAHRNQPFVPEYSRVTLSKESDYETIFRQTGLGKCVVDKLLKEDKYHIVLETQEKFWKEKKIQCNSVFGMFTRVDKVKNGNGITIIDLQPGDILITLSTHSVGWHHGHAGLVLDEKNVLECVKWGQNSEVVNVKHWEKYSDFAVLRVKDASKEEKEKVVEFAKENLCGVPYRLSVGILSEKDISVKSSNFGTNCGHSIWWVWKKFGYDLDSDGGQVVTPYDILCSEQLEVIQIYGMNPNTFQ